MADAGTNGFRKAVRDTRRERAVRQRQFGLGILQNEPQPRIGKRWVKWTP